MNLIEKKWSNIGFTLFNKSGWELITIRDEIENIIRKIAREPTSLKTALDETWALRQTPLVTPKPKRVKKNVRSRRRYQREYKQARWEETADEKRRQQGTIRGQFHLLRRAAKKKAAEAACTGSGAQWEWDLTLAEWCSMWMECPMVEVPGSNCFLPAYQCRGRFKDDVQLKRIDSKKPWNINNLQIIQRKKVLWVKKPD